MQLEPLLIRKRSVPMLAVVGMCMSLRVSDVLLERLFVRKWPVAEIAPRHVSDVYLWIDAIVWDYRLSLALSEWKRACMYPSGTA